MELAVTLLLLVFGVVISNLIATKVKYIPTAFFQIFVGLLLSLLPPFQDFEMLPEVFLFVIISVLMFNEGQHTNIRQLARHLDTTLSMSVWLSLATILVVGFVTHLFLPVLSIPLTFVLGAIITPTDSVAVTSITSDLEVPSPVMNTLSTESLFNDASGLVVFNLCIATLMTGKFSIVHAVWDFIYVFGGGIIVGLFLGWLIVLIRLWMIRQRFNGSEIIIPFNLLTPFIVYILAEEFGVSGILAVVAAGIVQGWQQNLLKLSSSRLQITNNSAWELVSNILNGIVFILLGVSFPEVWRQLRSENTHSLGLLLGLGLVLYLVMVLIRFLWVYLGFVRISRQSKETRVSDSALIAVSGVHGTITLAMAFSLPLTMNHHPLYDRADLIFISAVVIVLSLLVPTIVLQFKLPQKERPFTRQEFDKAKGQTIDSAIELVMQAPKNQSAPIVIQILNSQRNTPVSVNRKRVGTILEQTRQVDEDTIAEMIHRGELTDREVRDYERLASVTYRRLDRGFWARILDLAHRLNPYSKLNRSHREWFHEMKKQPREQVKAEHRQWVSDMQRIEEKPFKAVNVYLDKIQTPENKPEVLVVRSFYDQRHQAFNRNPEEQTAVNRLLTSALQEEYSFVQRKTLDGEFSKALGSQLFDDIANDQMLFIQQNSDAN